MTEHRLQHRFVSHTKQFRAGCMLLLCLAAATLTRTALGQEPVDTIGNKYFIFFPNIMVPIVLANIDLTIVNPPDGSSAQSVNTYFSWSGIPGSASEFRWIVKLEANDSSPDVEVVSDLTHIEVTLPRLAQNTTYFWQVFGIDNYGRTASSHVASFTTDRVQSNPNVNAMVHVPAGEFRMGCDVDNLDGMICHGKDLPLHAVWLDGYFIDDPARAVHGSAEDIFTTASTTTIRYFLSQISMEPTSAGGMAASDCQQRRSGKKPLAVIWTTEFGLGEMMKRTAAFSTSPMTESKGKRPHATEIQFVSGSIQMVPASTAPWT
jgi:hypothetical protein